MWLMDEEHVDPFDETLEQEPEETVDGLPVLAEVYEIERAAPTVLPTVQAAAVAATGFLAGAATMALMKRHAGRKLAAAQGGALGGRRIGGAWPTGGTRTYLVQVRPIYTQQQQQQQQR